MFGKKSNKVDQHMASIGTKETNEKCYGYRKNSNDKTVTFFTKNGDRRNQKEYDEEYLSKKYSN